MLQEQNSEKSATFMFSEKTTICLNVSVPWVSWMPEASGLTPLGRFTLLVLMIEPCKWSTVLSKQIIILLQQIHIEGVHSLPQFIVSSGSI